MCRRQPCLSHQGGTTGQQAVSPCDLKRRCRPFGGSPRLDAARKGGMRPGPHRHTGRQRLCHDQGGCRIDGKGRCPRSRSAWNHRQQHPAWSDRDGHDGGDDSTIARDDSPSPGWTAGGDCGPHIVPCERSGWLYDGRQPDYRWRVRAVNVDRTYWRSKTGNFSLPCATVRHDDDTY